MAYVLRGTVTVEPGSGELQRVLDIPALCVFGATGNPITYLSSVHVANPADVELFDYVGTFGLEPTTNSLKGYFGGRKVVLYYQLSGESAIDVEFELVWGTPGSDIELTYAGD